MSGKPIPAELTEAYEQALEAGDVDGVLRAADSLGQRGHSRSGEAWLRHAWRTFPADARIAVRLLEIYLRYRAWEDFDRVASGALAQHPDSADVHYTVGCGHEIRGRWAASAEAFGRAADIHPDEIEGRLRQVRSLRIDGETAKAQKALKRAIKQHPQEAALYAQLGYTWIDREDPAEAAKWFQKAVDRQPDWQRYLDDLAGALMLCERWEDAARAAIRSLDRRKKNERAWTVYAIAHHRLDMNKRAEQGYVNAIRAAKDPSRAQGNYGLFLASDPSRMLEAVRMLKRARQAHPDWTEITDALQRLVRQ